MAINKMVLYGYSKSRIRAEIEKCELLCANCHARFHRAESGEETLTSVGEMGLSSGKITEETLVELEEAGYTKTDRLRLWTSLYKRDRGCQSCGESDPVPLQFHHENGDKTLGVGAMISDSYPTKEVLVEVENCTVLCANCHRKTHRR
jgi:5-methylcytosine-specific restriction endonuclease McrA